MPSLIIREGASSEPTTEAIQQSERSVKQEKRYSFTPSSSPPDPTVKPRSASVLVSPRVRQFQLHDYDSIHFAKKKLSVASSDGTFSAESAGESPKSSTTGPSSAVNGPFLTGPLAKEFRHPEPFDILSPRSRERDEIRKIDLHATGLLFPPAPAFSSSNEMEFYHLSYLPDQQIHSYTTTINHTMQCNTSESEVPAEHKDSSSLHVSHQENAASIYCALQETVEYETLARHSDEKVTHQSDTNVLSSSTFQLSSHDEVANRASTPVTTRTINDNEPFDNEFGEQRVVSSIVARDVAFHDTFDRVTVGMLDAMKSLLPHTDEKMTHAQVELTCIVRKVQTQLEILNSASQRIRTDFEQNTRRLVQTSEEKRFAEAKVEYLEQMIEQVKKERDSLQQQLSQSRGKENQFKRSTLSNIECCISDSRIQSLDLLSSLQKDVTSLYSAVGAIPSLVEKIDEIQKAQAEAHTTLSRVRSTNFEDIMHRNHSDTNSTKGSDSSGGTNWRLYITVVLVGVTFWCITLSSIYILFQYALMPQMHQQGKFTGLEATNPTQNSMIQASMSGIKVSDPFLHHDGESSGDEMCIADPERFNPTATSCTFHDTFDRVTVGMLDAMKSLLPHTDEKMTHAQVELTCIVRKVQTQLEILNSASQRIRTDFEQNTRRLVQTSEEKRFAEAKVEYLEQMIEQVKKERDSLQQQLSQSRGKENQFKRSTLSNIECCISDSRIQSLDLLSSLQKDVTSLYSAVGAIPSLVEKIDEIQKAQAEAHTTLSRVRSTNFEDIMHRNHSDTNSTKGSDSSGGTNWRLYITVVLVGVTFWCITLSSIYILFQYALMPQMHQQGKFTGLEATNPTQNSMIQASMSGIKVSDPFLHHDGESSGDEMCIADPERFNPTATSCSGIVAKKTLPIKNMDSEQLEGRYQATNDDDVSKSHVLKDEQILQSKLKWQQTLFIALGHFHDQFFSRTKSHLLNFGSSWSWHPDLSEQLFRALGRLTHALKALTGTYSSITNGNVTKHEISGDGMSGELVNNQPDNVNPESDNTSIDSLLNVHSNSSIATLMHSFVNEEDSEANLTRRSTHTVSQILVDGLRNKNTKVSKVLGLSEERCTEKNPICTWYDFFTIYTVPVKISAVKDQADPVYDLNKMGSKKSVVSHVKIRTTWDNKSICSFSDQPVSHRLPDDTFSPRSYDQRTTNVKAAMRGDKLPLDEGSDDQYSIAELKALSDKSNAISALKGQNLDDIWRGEGLDIWQSVNVFKTTLQKDLSSASADGDEEESSQIVEKRFDSDGSSTAMSSSGESEQSYCPLKTPFPTNANELCSTSSPALVSGTELSGAPITKPIGAIGNLAASLVSMVRDPDQH
ncbi:hypothetical protein ABG067_001295 [Albugo candida]